MLATAQPAIAETTATAETNDTNTVINVQVSTDSDNTPARAKAATETTQVNVGTGLDVLATVLGLIAIVGALLAGWFYAAQPLGLALPF